MTNFQCTRLVLAMAAAWGLHGAASAQVIVEDTLTGASSSYRWRALNGACLTAGNNTGTIPACAGLPYYGNTTTRPLVGGTTGRLPDTPGNGALRLTNGDFQDGGSNGDQQTGAVVSEDPFPTNAGLEVTFTTVTYGGDNLNGHGADGISFYLMDGSRPPSVGGSGGSLGYSCSNTNNTTDGVTKGYLGIGIDEFGNFSNSGDNTDTGPGFFAGRVTLRGAGDTNFAGLNALRPSFYPNNLSTADKIAAVKNTCRTGFLWNYGGTVLRDANNVFVADRAQSTQRLAYNYPYISHSNFVLPAGATSIANQQGVNMPLRGTAIPVTYSLRLTQNRLLDFTYSVNGGTAQTVVTNQNIASNGPLPASFRFGFSSGTGGGNNVHEITCFKAAPVEQSNTSAGTNTQPTSRVEAGSQLFLAYFHPTNWWGQLTAQSLLLGADDSLSLSPTVNWDAHCTLTGGTCAATGAATTRTAPANRIMLTWNPATNAGIPFQWTNLTATQKAALTAGDASQTSDRLEFLRGDRSREIANGGAFRTRTSVLGDIVDSSPTWVGYPNLSYTGTWKDALYSGATLPENGSASYDLFKTNNATRENMVYVGANDGFLHAFRAGAFRADGTFDSASTTKPNDGREVLAFMPNAVLSTIHSTTANLDYPGPQYSHNFFVNATPGTGDLYYGGAWHTWLVSGLGVGGNASGPIGDRTSTAVGALFALDITNPSNFTEAQASSIVLGEWTSSTLTCTNLSTCGTSLGSVTGTPIIRRLHNGKWGVIFGNGLNSATGNAAIYIMVVDPSNGARSFLYLPTGSGPSGATKNGIVNVSSADFDGDHITDYLYAGDALGNVWRFDVTGSTVTAWSSATPYKLFAGSSTRPITTRVTVSSVGTTVAGEKPRVMVGFGTGQMLPQTATAAAVYATGTQYLYGIWDANMSSWNSKTTDANKRQSLASFTASIVDADLQDQTVTSTIPATGEDSAVRTVSQTKVCFKGSSYTGCSTSEKYGWRLELPGSSEQIIFNPTTVFDFFVVNTVIPGVNRALTCESTPASGFTMAVSVAEGAAPKSPFFALSTAIPNSAAVGDGATGTPSMAHTEKQFFLLQQTNSSSIKNKVRRIFPSASGKGGRLNWKKVR